MKSDTERTSTTVRTQKWTFLATFVVVFFVSFGVLDAIGLAPNPSIPETVTPSPTPGASSGPSVAVAEGPVRIIADSIDMDEAIQNPASTDIATLDKALLNGVVRYPGSALLGQDANMLLFGHSSYLAIVHNSAYRAFNDIQKLAIGDEIRVQSAHTEYRYKVASVRLADASETLIDLTPGVRKLTLSTCNSFGAKQERFVVEAEFVNSRSL